MINAFRLIHLKYFLRQKYADYRRTSRAVNLINTVSACHFRWRFVGFSIKTGSRAECEIISR